MVAASGVTAGWSELNELGGDGVGQRFPGARQNETVALFSKQAESDEFARLRFK